jgi:hypothetical protein
MPIFRKRLRASRKIARIEAIRPVISVIPHIFARAARHVVPLDQNQVATQTGRKSVLVAHYVVSTAVTGESSHIVSTRDVSFFGIKWISIGPVKLVGEKGQWICIEAFLCGHLSVRDRTCLESKVTHVVSSEQTLKGDVGVTAGMMPPMALGGKS